MSDKQPEDNRSDDTEAKGGWKQPEQVGGWKAAGKSAVPQTGGWKRVRAMPSELDETPTSEGIWHLPRPEDTPFGPDDTIQIADKETPAPATRPEDMVFGPSDVEVEEETVEAPEAPPEEPSGDLETYTGLGELVATLSAMTDEQPAPSIMIGETEEQETAEAHDLGADSDELIFGDVASPERDALEQAIADQSTEQYPPDQVRQPTAKQAQAEEETAEPVSGELDPAEVARRRIAELQQDAEPVLPVEPEAPQASDAAEIARQHVAELSGGAAAAEPAAPATPAEPPVDELTRKFRETQAQVRTLRQQYQNGAITRDQLQQQLRQYMVLDNNDVWWMMGVESDTWYRYDKASANWVVATPPVDLGAASVPPQAPRTVTSEFRAEDVIAGQLPYLLDDEPTVDETADTEHTAATQEFYTDPDMPLPRADTPIRDPEYTVPGMAAINQDTVRASDAATYDRGFEAGQTVPSQPVYQPAAGYATDDTPRYDALDSQSELYQQAVQRQRQSMVRRILLIASLIVGAMFIIGAALVLIVVVSYNNIASLYTTQINDLVNYQPNFQSVRIVDANGDLIAELNSQNGGRRVNVSLSQMAPDLIFAVVGSEDERFYENPGFDSLAIVRAFLQNLRAGQVVSGASTITQQVADMVINNQGTTEGEKKLHEIVIASEIARKYDKNFILQLYMNEVFFGNQSYGVEAASEFYFNKKAADVNLVEGAMLASLIRNPAVTPVSRENRNEAFANTDAVLRKLATVGCLNFQHPSGSADYIQGQPFCIKGSDVVTANGDFTPTINVARAELQARTYQPLNVDNEYPHFVQYISDLLSLEYGDEMFRDGFTVTTTLDPRIQNVAQSALRQILNDPNTARGLQTGAVMVADPTTGNIMAMVGSPDFNNTDLAGQVNGALTWQQPGSTIKPVVYASAFEGIGDANGNGVLDFNEYLTPASLLWDVPTQYQNPPYTPVDFDGRFRGPMSVRSALANSINVAAVKAYNFIGNERFVDTANRMGLTFLPEAQFGLPTAVGATEVRLIDMMRAYSVLADTGRSIPLRAITQITNADGTQVELRGRLAAQEPQTVVEPSIAFLLQNILSDNNARGLVFGLNTPLYLPEFDGAIAAKTGTTNDNRDLWTMGFSRNTVVGVWLGRPDNNPTQADSLTTAAPIFNTVMRAALEGRQRPGVFTGPGNTVPAGGIITQVICNTTGALPDDSCTERRSELFAADRPPAPADQGAVVNIPIDTWTGLRANQFCQDNIQMGTFVNLFPPDPWALQWLAGAGQQTAQRMGLPIPPQSPPANACDVNTLLPTARIVNPAEGMTVSQTLQITGAVSAQNFDRYQIEIAPANTNTFTIVAGPFQTQQPTLGSVLTEWDSRTVENGQYILRLSMFATAASGGGFLNRDVHIIVQNVQPTATPIPTEVFVATPTTLPFPEGTTIPFGSQSLGQPTPTATITVGG